jgi:hypothetical protein
MNPYQPGEGEGAAQGAGRDDARFNVDVDAAAASVREEERRDHRLAARQGPAVVAKIENVEWAQWLSGAFQGQLRPDVISTRRACFDFDRYGDRATTTAYDLEGVPATC